MTAPITAPPTTLVLPNGTTYTLPPKTPKALIHTVALIVGLVPILLAVAQPDGTFTTPAAQAAIVLVGLLVAAGIFLAVIISENIAHYGLTKAAVGATVTDSEAELRQLLPEAKALFGAAQPIIAQLGPVNTALTSLQSDVGTVKARLDQIPADQRAAAAAAVQGALGALVQAPPPPPAVVPGVAP